MATRVNLEAFERLSLYEVLDIPEDADAEEVKKAYRRKALEHHPDKNLDDIETAQRRFARVQRASEILSDENLRADYDNSRFNKTTLPTSTGHGTDTQYTSHHHFTPRPQSTGGVPIFLLPLFWFLSIVAAIIGLFTSIKSAFDPLPAPISYFRPAAYAYRSPAREKSATIDHIVAFLASFRTLQCTLDSGPLNFFAIMGGFFECIAFEEGLHGSKPGLIPRLGYMSSPRHLIEQFYKYWSQFETTKDFTWMSFHQVPAVDLAHPQGRAIAEYQNQLGRRQYKLHYESLIRGMATSLKDVDPRLVCRSSHAPKPSGPPKGGKKGKNKKKWRR